MANFAKINDSNIVTDVTPVHDSVITDENGDEQESLGIAFLRNTYKEPSANWIQTSYNTRHGEHTQGKTQLRYNYAGVGYTYDAAVDAFRPPKPFPSWILNSSKQIYEAPVALPVPQEGWSWDESVTNWRDEDGAEYTP